jgi:hypothetical protein
MAEAEEIQIKPPSRVQSASHQVHRVLDEAQGKSPEERLAAIEEAEGHLREADIAHSKRHPLPPHVKQALDIAQKRADPYGGNKDLAEKVRHALPTEDIKRVLARRKAEAEAQES